MQLRKKLRANEFFLDGDPKAVKPEGQTETHQHVLMNEKHFVCFHWQEVLYQLIGLLFDVAPGPVISVSRGSEMSDISRSSIQQGHTAEKADDEKTMQVSQYLCMRNRCCAMSLPSFTS